MGYEQIKRNYERGLWSEKMVMMAGKAGVITQEQAEAIIVGKPAPESGSSPADVDLVLDMLEGKV